MRKGLSASPTHSSAMKSPGPRKNPKYGSSSDSLDDDSRAEDIESDEDDEEHFDQSGHFELIKDED